MKIRLLLTLLTCGLLCGNIARAALPEPELVFNCELTNGKGVVVRLNNDVPVYYYGSMEKVELTLPKIPDDRTQVRVGEMMFSGGGALYFRFINGNYSYVVYSGMGKGWDFTGLKVYQGKKVIMKKECENGGFISTNNYRGENLVKDADTGDDGIYGYAD